MNVMDNQKCIMVIINDIADYLDNLGFIDAADVISTGYKKKHTFKNNLEEKDFIVAKEQLLDDLIEAIYDILDKNNK